MAQPHVLIFSLAYPPFIGGAELAIKEITDRIPDARFTIVTANLDGRQPAQERLGNVVVHRVGTNKWARYWFPWSAVTVAEHLIAQDPITLIWGMMANQAGLAALRLKRRHADIPYLLTLQEGDSIKKIWSRTWWMRHTYKAIYRSADRIQAISQYLAQRARRYGYNGPLEVIPNGVDLWNFQRTHTPEEREALRQRLGLNASDRVIVTASRLVVKNGIDILVRALQGNTFRLVIAGTGRDEVKLRSLALDLGVNDRIHFVGHIGHEDLPLYLSIGQVFVRPSRSEGLGSAFIEAMAAGLPVVAPPVGGIPDFLRDGENGLCSEPNNPRDLAMKIGRIFDDPALYETLVAGAKATAAQYDWDDVTERMRPLLGV